MDDSDSDTEVSPTRRLQLDGDPFYAAWTLVDSGGWLLADGIQSELQEDWNVNEDALSSTLYNLEDRDLIEKRPYEDDRRYKEYRITQLGEDAFYDAIERSESLSKSDID